EVPKRVEFVPEIAAFHHADAFPDQGSQFAIRAALGEMLMVLVPAPFGTCRNRIGGSEAFADTRSNPGVDEVDRDMAPPTLGAFIVVEFAALEPQDFGIEFRRKTLFPWPRIKTEPGT